MELSLSDLYRKFPDDKTCLEYVFEVKYKKTRCPHCKKVGNLHWNKSLNCFTCSCGQYHLYPKKGTLFAQSRVGLGTWFPIMYLLCERAMSVKEMERIMGISYTAAAKIHDNIAQLMYQDIKNKHVLHEWKKQMRSDYNHISQKNEEVVLGMYQWRYEQKKAKKESFERLLKLALHEE